MSYFVRGMANPCKSFLPGNFLIGFRDSPHQAGLTSRAFRSEHWASGGGRCPSTCVSARIDPLGSGSGEICENFRSSDVQNIWERKTCEDTSKQTKVPSDGKTAEVFAILAMTS